MKFHSMLLLAAVSALSAAELEFERVHPIAEPGRAEIIVHASRPAPRSVSPWITGKFCEHLGANIYNGMSAQILRNPTFADVPFFNGQMTRDGETKFQTDEEKIAQDLRRQAARIGWPETELDSLVEGRAENLASWWVHDGAKEALEFSPDTAPNGGRAQRIQARTPRVGLGQWTPLPLHRIRKFEFELFARSPEAESLLVGLRPSKAGPPSATARVTGLTADWKKFTGRLELGPSAPAEAAYEFFILAERPGQLVLQRALLRPADHIHGADPDVIRFLKESRLPILRWPGGNFSSTYHWEDGIGPIELRPTKPNFAWGGIEPNYFGTDEFMAFCRAVGCEPMICLNAGSGTPEEAARWIEYCNGPADSPMGARRAANGHPEPYRVKFWEVGNELWGRWQFHWTTPEGYVDRYRQFAKAIRRPGIQLLACGAPVLWGAHWNDTLIRGLGPGLEATTDHPLIGGTVSPALNPLDVYRDFMIVPDILEQKWRTLESRMRQAGISEPRLAVTELQMFAHLGRPTAGQPAKLTPENLVNPGTLAEALYDTLIYHAAIRLGPFVEMVTHSATVNHGGGLRKQFERVYANPCYYAQAAFRDFAGSRPVAIDLATPTETAPIVLPDLKLTGKSAPFGVIAALAALAPNGDMLLSLVHRGTRGPVRLEIALEDFRAGQAEALVLTGELPWQANSLDNPTRISPRSVKLPVEHQKLDLELEPYSVWRVRIQGAAGKP